MKINSKIELKPILKWAGGKNKLSEQILLHFPKKIDKYFEPFVGAGAIFLKMRHTDVSINDLNEELISLYKCFKNENDFNELIKQLKELEKNHSEENYYKVREMDNYANFKKLNNVKKAARLIYLNKTCFNGIYRVNSKGHFNVPWNKKNKVKIFDIYNFNSIREYFKHAIISINNTDFSYVLKKATKGDLVYFDPPYHPLNKTSSFTTYTKSGFNESDQIRLKEVVDLLTKKGVYVLVSNSNTDFIKNLYSDYRIVEIKVKRLINSIASRRGEITELLIINYGK